MKHLCAILVLLGSSTYMYTSSSLSDSQRLQVQLQLLQDQVQVLLADARQAKAQRRSTISELQSLEGALGVMATPTPMGLVKNYSTPVAYLQQQRSFNTWAKAQINNFQQRAVGLEATCSLQRAAVAKVHQCLIINDTTRPDGSRGVDSLALTTLASEMRAVKDRQQKQAQQLAELERVLNLPVASSTETARRSHTETP